MEIKNYDGSIEVIESISKNYKIMVCSKFTNKKKCMYVGNMKAARTLYLELTRKYDLVVTVVKCGKIVNMENEVLKRQLKGYYDLDTISDELKEVAKSINCKLALNNSKR